MGCLLYMGCLHYTLWFVYTIWAVNTIWVVYTILCGLFTQHKLLISSQFSGAISLLIWLLCVDEKLWILISWLLMKPADLDLQTKFI